jgi:glycosyltransferase involved in cell wall biosynthesis
VPARRGLLVVAAALDSRGGLQRLLGWTLQAIAEDEPVTVVTWSPRARPSIRREGALTVVRVPSLGRWDAERGRLTGPLDTGFSVLTALVASVFLRRRWGAVYGAGLVPEGLAAVLAGRLLRRPVTLGTWATGELGNVARLRRSPVARLEARLLARATTIAESPQIAEELSAAGFPAARIHVVTSGVRIEPVPPRSRAALPAEVQDGERVLVAAARFDLRQKRFDVLVEGWRRARLEGWRLVLVGEGPDEARVRELAASLDPAAAVLGWQERLAPLFAGAEAFALPTEAEGTGLVVLEGMAAALPGLVSDTAPFDRSRPDGITLVANDPDAWAEALRALAAAPDREEQGRRARVWVEAHGDVRTTIEVYRAMLVGGGTTTGAGRATQSS